VSAATIPPLATPEPAINAPQVPETPRYAPREPLFNEAQQKAFEKAWSKRERKLHADYAGVLRDLIDTVGLTMQLLERCKDRLSVEDEVAIRDGLIAIGNQYGDRKWQRRS
jgi:hypothetical protein